VLSAPWDAPLQWSLFANAVLLFAALFFFGLFMRSVFRRPLYIPPIFVVRFGLLGASIWLFLCDLEISLLVLWPAHDRLDAWYVGERARLLAFNCDLAAFNSA
jgi:hypothetical protein